MRIAMQIPALLAVCMFSWAAVVAQDLTPKQELGKQLFFDTNLSTPPGMSCATCHQPSAGFSDARGAVSPGVLPPRCGDRNAPSVAYAAFSPPLHYDPTPRPGVMSGMYVGGLFWDGRVNTLEEQAEAPFLNPLEMHNPNRQTVANSLRRADYADLFTEVFGPASLTETNDAFAKAAEAIAAYERSAEINPFSSKYDAYRAGAAELTEAEARGLALFTSKAKCMNCHSPEGGPEGKPLFTNFGYQNTGVPKNTENPFYLLPPAFNSQGDAYVDPGLGGFLNDPMEKGKFRIPSLRNVAVTPPYMHNGVFQTMREVVHFNNTRDVEGAGWPPPETPENVHRHMPPMPGTFGQLGLTDQEEEDIVAFLHTLTDGYEP
jgi:cytochrome c peroxidase